MLETNIGSKSSRIRVIHEFHKKKKGELKLYVYTTAFNRSSTCRSTMTINFENYLKTKDPKIKGHIETRNIWIELIDQ